MPRQTDQPAWLRWWGAAAAVFTVTVAHPELAAGMAVATTIATILVWFEWKTSTRPRTTQRPLLDSVGPTARACVESVLDQVDPHRRARLVVDSSERYASVISGPHPVISVSPHWATLPQELAAVVAHEYGHLAGRHWRTSLWVYPGTLVWACITVAGTAIVRGYGGPVGWAAASLVAVVGIWCGVILVLRARNRQRRNEFDADLFAARLVGPGWMASALRATGTDRRSHVGAWSRHPHLSDRIAALEALSTGSPT